MILSVNDSSKVACIFCGKTNPTIATPISSKKNIKRHNEYWNKLKLTLLTDQFNDYLFECWIVECLSVSGHKLKI